MEVHAHSHTERKKFTHYLWEFLMLFLAVFCGFLAENQREHIVEHQREKQFMKTLIIDLENDTTNFNRSISIFQSSVTRFDSLKASIKNPANQQAILDSYKASLLIQYFSSFNYSDRTIEQLRNAGNFRLITKQVVSDSLIDYDRYIRHTYLIMENLISEHNISLSDIQNEIFDYDLYNFLLNKSWPNLQNTTTDSVPFPLKFINKDEKKLMQYYNSLGICRNWWRRMVNHSNYAKKLATNLLILVKKEYHLE